MLKKEIKVCGMKNPIQILELHGIDYIGLIFVKESPRNAFEVSPSELSGSFSRVGVFKDAETDLVLSKAIEFDLNIIQLHGNESPEKCNFFREQGYLVWKAFPISDAEDLNAIQDYTGKIDRVLLDTKSKLGGGTGKSFDWEILEKYIYDIPFMLAGGISIHDTPRLKAMNHPYLIGFDINSRFEISPGVKDTNLINQFVELINE